MNSYIDKNFHSHFLSLRDNTKIHYQLNDNYDESLPTLIFNYGLVCNNEHWRYQIPFFNDLKYPIVLHDYRAHFKSQSSPVESCTFQNIVEDIEELKKHLNINQFVMLGHSMGVNVTLEYFKKCPSDKGKAILISGSVIAPHDVMFDSNLMSFITPYLDFIRGQFPQAFKVFWKNSYKFPIIRGFIHRGGFNTKQVNDEFVKIYMEKISELPEAIFFKLLEEMRQHDIARSLDKINNQCLVIGGDKDKVIPNYLQQQLSNSLPNSTLYIVKDGSHVPQADFPESLNQRIQHFIENN